MPAASSRMSRRAWGFAAMISPIWPWRTSAGERAPVEASANRSCTSRARTSLAVDAIGRAGLALDAAGDLDRLVVVEGGRRAAVGIVEHEPDFGDVARRPLAGAGEDDVVHARAAHGLVRALAHHPAQSLDEIRLAAAVRPDDAGQSRLDLELGGVAEALEAGQTQALELHRGDPSARRSTGALFRDQTSLMRKRPDIGRAGTRGHIGATQSTPEAEKNCANRPQWVRGARIWSNLSSLWSPLRRAPSMKKVGVDLTPSLPAAASRIALTLSSRA